jgi:hypothetical protein
MQNLGLLISIDTFGPMIGGGIIFHERKGKQMPTQSGEFVLNLESLRVGCKVIYDPAYCARIESRTFIERRNEQ